jgi:hypothetical protein
MTRPFFTPHPLNVVSVQGQAWTGLHSAHSGFECIWNMNNLLLKSL